MPNRAYRSSRAGVLVIGGAAVAVATSLLIMTDGPHVPVEPEHHTLKITTPVQNPSQSAKQDLLKLLADCTKQNLSFGNDGETVVDRGNLPGVHYEYLRALKDEIIASGKTMELKVVAGPHREVFVDDWGGGREGDHINGLVDMSDINTYPQDVPVDSDRDGNPDGMAPQDTWVDTNEDNIPDRPAANAPRPIHAMTRCTLIAHVLGERFVPLQTEKEIDYYESHQTGGFGSENALIQERPVDDKSKSDVGVEERRLPVLHDGHRDVVTTNDDGSGERAHVTGANGEFTITYFPAPPRTPARSPRSPAEASSPLSFEGCVRRVSDAPGAWSGVSDAYQEVRYRVRDVLRGRDPGRRVAVLHTIVQGDPDVRTEEPALRPWVRKGAAVRVRATLQDSAALGTVYIAEARITKDRSRAC